MPYAVTRDGKTTVTEFCNRFEMTGVPVEMIPTLRSRGDDM